MSVDKRVFLSQPQPVKRAPRSRCGSRPAISRSSGTPAARCATTGTSRRSRWSARAGSACASPTGARSSTRSPAGGARRSATATRACAAALRDQQEAFEHVITANTTSAPLVRLCERLLAAANGAPAGGLGRRRAARSPARPLRQGVPGRQRLDRGRDRAEDGAAGAGAARAARRARASRRCENGYHGETVARSRSAISSSTRRPTGRSASRSQRLARAPLPQRPARSALARRRGEAWPAIEAALDAAGATTLAAIVYEPVLQAAGGMLLLQPRSAAPAARLGRRARRLPDRRRDRRRDGAPAARCWPATSPTGAGARLDGRAARLRGAVEGADRRRAAAVGGADHRRDLRAVRRRLRRRGAPSCTRTRTPATRSASRSPTRCSTSSPTTTCSGAWRRRARGCARRWRRVAATRPYLRDRARLRHGGRRRHPRRATAAPLDPARRTGYAGLPRGGPARRAAAAARRHDVPLPAADDDAAEIDEMAAILGDSLDAVAGASGLDAEGLPHPEPLRQTGEGRESGPLASWATRGEGRALRAAASARSRNRRGAGRRTLSVLLALWCASFAIGIAAAVLAGASPAAGVATGGALASAGPLVARRAAAGASREAG